MFLKSKTTSSEHRNFFGELNGFLFHILVKFVTEFFWGELSLVSLVFKVHVKMADFQSRTFKVFPGILSLLGVERQNAWWRRKANRIYTLIR